MDGAFRLADHSSSLSSSGAEDQPISRKLWDMLIYRCPHLEELSIDGTSTIPTDIHALVQGRWPKLRKLALGDICIDWIPRPLTPGEKRPFIAFLEAHHNLKVINLSRHNIQPIHFATLDSACLSGVTSFSGTHQQLQALPHIHPLLKQVSFRDPVETREISAPTIASLLRDLTSLTDLRITFALHSMYDSGNLLRSLIQSCPNLRHLELTCAHKPSFQLVRSSFFFGHSVGRLSNFGRVFCRMLSQRQYAVSPSYGRCISLLSSILETRQFQAVLSELRSVIHAYKNSPSPSSLLFTRCPSLLSGPQMAQSATMPLPSIWVLVSVQSVQSCRRSNRSRSLFRSCPCQDAHATRDCTPFSQIPMVCLWCCKPSRHRV